jgi:iron complex outermembrane receptor protein
MSLVRGRTHGGANDSVDAAINLPVIKDTLAVRLSGYDDHLSGIYDRVATPGAPVDYGEQKGIDASSHNGGSISASLTLLDNALTITPRVIVQHMTADGHTYADYTAGNLTQYRLFNLDESGSDQWNLYSLTVKYKTPVGTITSDSSEFIRKSADSEDDSEVVALFFGTPDAPVLFHQTSRDQNFSQELRFASEFSGPLQVTGGAFYQDSGELLGTPVTPDAPYISNIFSSRTDTQITETALFGEVTYSITSQFKAIAGVRWFNNNVKSNGNEAGLAVNPASYSDTQHQAGFNPKYGLEYKVNDDDMVYATAAKGFRTGGVNAYSNTLCAADLAALGLTNTTAQSFVSDSVWSYEVGTKTSWLDHRLRVDAAVFDIEWSHVQQLVDLPTCGFGITVNGGAARSQGAELELQAAVTEALRLSVGAGYVDAKIVNSGALNILPDGSPIQQVPKWTYNATGDYRFNLFVLPAFARIEYAHVGSSISENNSIADPLFRPSYSLTKVRSGVDIKQWEITAFADNVFNAHANLADAQPQAIVLPGRPRFVTNRPRTIGVDLRFKF